MRQYYVLYKRGAGGTYKHLQPGRDMPLYERVEVAAAVETLVTFPFMEAIALRVGDEMYNIVTFTQEAEAPNSFRFPTA